MRNELMRWMRTNRLIELMYIDRHEVVSKRRVKLIKVQGNHLIAWDVKKRARRTFCIDRVLACLPVIEQTNRERGAVV